MPKAKAKPASKLFTIGYEKAKPDARDGRTQARQGQAPGRHAGGRRLAQAGFLQAPARRRPRRERHRLSASAKARHARPRAAQAARAGKLDTLWRIYAKHLKTPEAIEAMDELDRDREVRRAGVPALLRARQGLLPPQPDRRDRARAHRRERRRSGRRRCSDGYSAGCATSGVALDAVDQQRHSRRADHEAERDHRDRRRAPGRSRRGCAGTRSW